MNLYPFGSEVVVNEFPENRHIIKNLVGDQSSLIDLDMDMFGKLHPELNKEELIELSNKYSKCIIRMHSKTVTIL